LLTGLSRCRLYLEDLTSGTLVCSLATGRVSEVLRSYAFPLTDPDFLVSRAYIEQQENEIEDLESLPANVRALAEKFKIRTSFQFPLIHGGRSIGVLCVDSGRTGALLDFQKRNQLRQFIIEVLPVLDQARKYHQQMVLARRVDEARKTAAARAMMKSAVSLIESLSLASVLVPGRSSEQGNFQGLEILASYSKDRTMQNLYEREGLIDLSSGGSLMARYISQEGVIVDDSLLSPLYISDLHEQNLQKKYLTEQIGLNSLYMVPRYDHRTRKIVCLVNYYTRESHQFSAFERGLLESHAEMAQRVVQEIGEKHMEIQVLSEINDLLQEGFEGTRPFLNRILAKATELIGADTGSIALVQERDGVPLLIVEEADGSLVGAKNKAWLKRNIPPLRIGGLELPASERSLTGYAVHLRQPKVIEDTLQEKGEGAFYCQVTEVVRSEIAVPISVEDQVLAVICLSSLTPYFFTEEHQHILQIIVQMIARHLAGLLQIERLTSEVQQLSRDVAYRDPKISSYKLGNLIGNSAKARQIIATVETISTPLFYRIAKWRRMDLHETAYGLPTILITGQTGSGKEFLFNNLYSRLNDMYQEKVNPRLELPMTKSNIAAYSGDLSYSELFGHKRGAFTGAHLDRRGILEEANGGIVFLDEIGDADPKTQVQLLRFLDNGGFVRLGENRTRYARVLLVAATNQNLRQLIAAGRFREDLFHRLSELTIEVPSLNERREDIPDLAVHILGQLHRLYRQTGEAANDGPGIDQEARQLLAEHDYSGNIRELRSVLLRALFFRQSSTITAADVRNAIIDAPPVQDLRQEAGAAPAVAIHRAIRAGEGDFWTLVHQPFSDKQITRNTVRQLVEEVRRNGARTMPDVARALKACDPGGNDEDEQKRFYKFKNFLYKTVKI
jgi:transcriptional regulator with GAF, ATPase, and Fis domain